MRPTDAGPARLLRQTNGRWMPVGEPLPPVDHPELHEPIRQDTTVWWHFADGLDVRSDDVLIVREHTVRLLDRCGPNHWAVARLAQVAGGEWADGRQVWSGRVVDPGGVA